MLQMTQVSNSSSRCVFLSIFSTTSPYEINIFSATLYFFVPRDLLLPVRQTDGCFELHPAPLLGKS